MNFRQTVVDNVEVIQSYAYDSIDARLNTGTITGSVPGFHAGADVGWFFSRYFGLGGVIRFARGTKKNARIGDGVPFDREVGGAQGGAGIRVRF